MVQPTRPQAAVRSYTTTAYSTGSSSATLTETRKEPAFGSSPMQWHHDMPRARQRRRHSSYQQRSWSADRENMALLLDRFLADLGRRLEMIETYGHLKIDEGVTCALNLLHSVHESCAHVGDEVLDTGRRRAKVLVETMEEQYQSALATKETLEQKVHEGIRLAENLLSDFEKRAYDVHQAGLKATAIDMLDSGKALGLAAIDDASHIASELMLESAEAARRAKLKVQTAIEEAVTLARRHGTIHYHHLPEPWRVNPHILKGYRFSENKLECIRSTFTTFSNETVNIWSHFLGLLIVLSIAFYFYPISPAFKEATNLDIFIAGCFFFAACKCLVCSCMWHTMSSISDQTLMERFACVDYTGISLLVGASIVSVEYTAFYCEPWSRWMWITMTGILGITGSVLPWHPLFNRADLAWMRVAFYVTLATTGLLPIVQLTIERGYDEMARAYSPIVQSLLVYLSGAILYAAKVPERWLPGKFDYAGGSHNIWHLAVLGGILFHYSAMQAFFREAFRRAEVEGCSVY
ncbi:hypothetical protein B0A48_05888 [Cryoendolithus antarcticus]|uniref:Uncharacterized protein n=1 Tax=Cryoendolithus antarcticus TaxID=1507870 RepID=A0A1V8TCL0_9PEZI|nr:hypothetical protein B0A48_05888 [Cryoendolithus antarcticus]